MEVKREKKVGTVLSEKLKEPSEYKVIFLNDDFTPMDFVVAVIVKVFHKSQSEATDLMFQVHNTGQATVGVFVYDIAVSKCLQVVSVAKENNFPLQCKVEEV